MEEATKYQADYAQTCVNLSELQAEVAGLGLPVLKNVVNLVSDVETQVRGILEGQAKLKQR